jgi:uncharacterized membrane protein YebE (DUF533 family)
MANLGPLLGMLLATRMAGRGSFGSALGTAALMRGGLASKAGLAGLAYLAYRAYQDGKARRAEDKALAGGRGRNPSAAAARDPATSGGLAGTIGTIIDSLTGGQMARRKGEPGRGDEIESYLDPAPPEPGAKPAAAAPPPVTEPVDEGRALLLIRAMIAAAHADGRITPEERRRIVARLDEAGADGEDHRLIDQELENPKSLDSLLADLKDHETAQQFYAASRAAMDGRTPTQTAYLDDLRNRLHLSREETTEIDRACQ